MSGYSITIHIRSEDPNAVQNAIAQIFETRGFRLVGNEAAHIVVDDEDKLPAGTDWYGVIFSGTAQNGWLTLTVDDWQDSGVLARDLSKELSTPVIEIWVADETHWGYTYYEEGIVKDRFADDPASVAEMPNEIALYRGNADALAPILKSPARDVKAALRLAQEKSGEFVGAPIDALGSAIGLHFEHALMGYEDFFEEDPDDYRLDLLDWPEFRHLAFQHPEKIERLSE